MKQRFFVIVRKVLIRLSKEDPSSQDEDICGVNVPLSGTRDAGKNVELTVSKVFTEASCKVPSVLSITETTFRLSGHVKDPLGWWEHREGQERARTRLWRQIAPMTRDTRRCRELNWVFVAGSEA